MYKKKLFIHAGGGRLSGQDAKTLFLPKAIEGNKLSVGLRTIFKELSYEKRRGFSFSQFKPQTYEMERGLRLEPEALQVAIDKGFISNDYSLYGDKELHYTRNIAVNPDYNNFCCMPDVYNKEKNVLVSIKCPSSLNNHHELAVELDKKYYHQLMLESIIMNTERCYLLSYFKCDQFQNTCDDFENNENIFFYQVDVSEGREWFIDRMRIADELFDTFYSNYEKQMKKYHENQVYI